MKILRRTFFGNPILRQTARQLAPQDIKSEEVQSLIADMRYTLERRQYGVGLAAPQVGKSLALSVISIRPTPNRPELEPVSLVIINPRIVQTYGRRSGLWEGCMSFGNGLHLPYAQALRYSRIRVSYMDENAKHHEKDFDGILGHVIQHEIDHLNGVLFVDHVKDTTTYTTIGEFRKRHPVKKRTDS